jgi:hypothetical protein
MARTGEVLDGYLNGRQTVETAVDITRDGLRGSQRQQTNKMNL